MSIYLDEKNPGKHKPFDDAAPDIVEYVRYLEVIAGKSANTAFSYYCDLRGFSRFMKRRRGLVPEDSEMKDIDPKGLDTAFWASVTKMFLSSAFFAVLHGHPALAVNAFVMGDRKSVV